MKKIVLAALIITLLGSLAFAKEAAKEPEKLPGKSVLIEVNFYSKVAGREVAISPKILVLEGKEATIQVGNIKTTLNGKEVETTGKAPGEKDKKVPPFYTSIGATPTILKGTSPLRVKMNVKFLVNNSGSILRRNFTMTVIEGEPWEFEAEDPDNKDLTRLIIKTTVIPENMEVSGFDKETGKVILKPRTKK